jgi:O-antigen/teichoic acid export membrane protein
MTSVQDSFGWLLRSAAVVFVGTALGRGLSLLAEVLIVRSLTPETFGTVALAYIVVLTATRVGLLGLPMGVARMASDRETDRFDVDYLRSGYALTLGSAAAIIGGLSLFRTRIAWLMGTPELVDLIPLFFPFVAAFPVARISIAGLRSKKESVGAVLSNDLGPRVGAISLFVVLAYLGRPFIGAIVYWVVTPVASLLLAIAFLYRAVSVRALLSRFPDPGTIKRLWSFSWPLAISSSLVTLMGNVDVLMIGLFLEPRPVGFYRSVQPLRQVTVFVLQSFAFLFLPLATEYYTTGELGKLNELYEVSSKWIALITFPFVLVFSLFSPDVVSSFFGSRYLPAAPALSVLTVGLFFNSLSGPNSDLIQAIGKPRSEMYAAAAGLVVNLLFNLALIPVFGIVGAALATALGYAAFNGTELLIIYRTTGAHPVSLSTFKPLVVTGVVAVTVAFFVREVELGLPALVGLGTLFIVTEAVATVVTGSLDGADRQLYDRFKRRLVDR